MLRFLNSLFSEDTRDKQDVSPDIINTAVERAIDGSDTRIRFFSDYRKQLREPVEHAVEYVIGLVDNLQEPSEISESTFSTDPRVRAFFVSPEHLRETIGGFQTVVDYLRQKSGALPNEIFGLLTMEREERRTLGMQLDGDHVRRDIAQVAVNFSHHRYLGPSDNEADTRREIEKRAFDFLVEVALERMASSRSKKSELNKHKLMHAKKLEAMKAGHWGLESMLKGTETRNPDISQLESEIMNIDEELGRFGSDTGDIQHSLDLLIDTFNRAEDWLGAHTITLHLDQMGIKVDPASRKASNKLELRELFSETGERRIAMLARFPRTEFPDKPDFFQQASRYLD